MVPPRLARSLVTTALAALLLAPAALATFLLAPTALVAQVALSAGESARGSVSKGDTIRYSVESGDDWFLFAEVEQLSADVAVRILTPEGSSIGTIDGPERGSERFSRQLREAGTYTIAVWAAGDEVGDFEIRVHRLEPLETDPEALTDQLMAAYTGDDTPGAAAQVWRDGRTLYSKAYGMANLAYGIPFRTDTRTNIGSTSKQFTAFAIMLQQERGLLSLDDDIRVHIPELPEFEDTVTVRHLITHTSGLREFLNLLIMEGRRLDRGDWIDRSELVDVVRRQPALQNAPGAEWNYNNTAFGLAALIVERTSGQAFDVFLRENVFEPLGMDRTMVRPSPLAIVPDASEGYTPGGTSYLQIGDLGGAVGAGGIYTSVEDLQTWAENYAHPRVGTRAIIDEMMTSYVLTDGEETGYGYGLGVGEHRGLRMISHGGADVAHRSGFVWYPEIRAGVTVQSNHADFNSGVAQQIAEAFFDDAMEAEDAASSAAEGDFDPESYDPEDFDAFAGRYALDAQPTFVLDFSREGETLYTQATGQQRIEIVPTSDSTFALTVVEASVTFHRLDDGSVEGVTLHQNGDNHATRLDDDATADWQPSEGELATYVGRYFSAELETYYELDVVEGALTVHHRRLDDFGLEAGAEPDAFAGGGLTLAFERDRSGRVIGFYVANGRTRDVRFGRVR